MPDAPSGVVTGGWPYAIAAYTITFTALVIYTWSLVSRLKKARPEEEPSS